MGRPVAVSGSAGSRVKVLLGKTGDDYVYFLNETDGSTEWLSRDWTVGDGGLPTSMAKQLNSCNSKGRYITNADFGPHGEWFVSGQ